jgi:hypothetical protein
VQTIVQNYMTSGNLTGTATISVDRNASIIVNGAPSSASQITINYPFSFIVLQPVMRLIQPGTTTGGPITMVATAIMRNEAP